MTRDVLVFGDFLVEALLAQLRRLGGWFSLELRDFASIAQQRRGVVGRQTASCNVVGLNDRDVLGALDARIGQDDRNSGRRRLVDDGA